jgi:uncharacterized protein
MQPAAEKPRFTNAIQKFLAQLSGLAPNSTHMIDISAIDWNAVLPFIAVGFVAQLIDGAIGMAFGVITNTLLVSVLGMPPAHASARVHLVEMFTTAASGISHIYHKNVDWKLFRRLALPGVAGAMLGAYVLTNIDASVAKPFVMTYLSLIGIYLLFKAWGYNHEHREPKIIAPLGLIGGFLDAAGGGGWGPVVTSNLLIQGASPRMTVGTVNTSEFFLTRGMVAAPLAAIVTRHVRPQRLMLMVGLVLTATSLFSLWKTLQ